MKTRRWLVLLGLGLFGSWLNAQEGDGETPEPEKASVVREQSIYIPYSKLREVFEKEGRGVFVPYEKFQELWKKARAADTPALDQQPPVSALITEIENDAVVEKDVVRVAATAKIEILNQGWQEIPLRLNDAAILSAKLDDQPARIVHRKDGYRLLIDKQDDEAKSYTLSFVYAKAITKSPGQNSVSFEAPQAPVNRWQVRIPQTGVKVNIHPLIAVTEPPGADDGDEADETVILAFVGAAPSVRVDWTPKAEGATGLDALVAVQGVSEVIINEGVLSTRASLTYQVSRAEVTQLRLNVPKSQKVVSVYDPNIRQWDVDTANDSQQVTIELFQPTRGTQNVIVELEGFDNDLLAEAIAAPVVEAVGVSRQQGTVVVRLGPELRADVASRNGLLQLDAGDLPKQLAASKWDFAYRFASLPYQLSFDVEKVQPQVEAAELVEAIIEPERQTVLFFTVFEVKRAGVFQFQFDLPPDMEIRQVRGHAAANAQAASIDSRHVEDDGKKLIVDLSRKAFGRVGVLIELQKRLNDENLIRPTGDKSELTLELPRVTDGSVDRTSGRLVVFAPESLNVTPTTSAGLRSISFNEAYQERASVRDGRFKEARQTLAYAYAEQAITLEVAVERKQPMIKARQLLEVRVESGTVEYNARVFFDVLYSSVPFLRIDFPTDLAAKIDNQMVDASLMVPQPEDLAEGFVALQFKSGREILGRKEIKLNWTDKIEDLDIGKSTDVTIPIPRPHGDFPKGQVVIGKAEMLDVRESGELGGLRPIDPQTDLFDGIQVKDAARAFEFTGDWLLQITATRYELEEIKRTSIERAVVRMVVTRGDEISVQALYHVRSARQRLNIKLPQTVDPTEGLGHYVLRVNGEPKQLERGDNGEHFIPLLGQSPEDPFLVELRYAMTGNEKSLKLPEFPTKPAIQKVRLCAYLPTEQALLKSSENWTSDYADGWHKFLHGDPLLPPDDSEDINWVTRDLPVNRQMIQDFEKDGKLYTFGALRPQPEDTLRLTTMNENALNAIIFLGIAIPGVFLVLRPLPYRLFAVGSLLTVLVLLGTFMPTLSSQVFDPVLFAAIGLVISVWVLLFMVRFSRERAMAFATMIRERSAAPSTSGEEIGTSPFEDGESESQEPAPEPDEAAKDEKGIAFDEEEKHEGDAKND